MKVKCIKNDWNMPYIKVGETYSALGPHPTRNDYFSVRGELGIIAFYKREWFSMKKISAHDRKRLRSLYVYLDKYDNEIVRKNIQRQIDEIKMKYK